MASSEPSVPSAEPTAASRDRAVATLTSSHSSRPSRLLLPSPSTISAICLASEARCSRLSRSSCAGLGPTFTASGDDWALSAVSEAACNAR
eukprot:scaffold420550_cov24-Prasinocladus_malaysianus.AAC.1